jgi:hypothetical protein
MSAMPEPINFVDTWKIRDGRLKELKDAARAFVDFVAENEPRVIAYNVYVDEVSGRSTVVQIHPDSESIEQHIKVAGPHFGRFMELYEPGGTIEIHGRPAGHLLEQMQQIAQQFGVTITVKEPFAGFTRYDAR